MKKSITILLIFLLVILGATTAFAEDKNNNPLLREIKIDGQDPEEGFDQFKSDYVMATDKDKVKIDAVPDDPNAKVEIKGNTNLNVGNNDIEVKVTAEDGRTTKSYYLHITRGDKNLANANLKSLEIEGYQLNPAFNTNTIEYLITYTGNVESLKINAVPENDKSKVIVSGNNDFNSKYHTVIIKVTAPNGITNKEYKITAKNITNGDKNDEEEENQSIIEMQNANKTSNNQEKNEEQKKEEQKENTANEVGAIAVTENKDNRTLIPENNDTKGNYFTTIIIIIGIILVIAVILLIVYKRINKNNENTNNSNDTNNLK